MSVDDNDDSKSDAHLRQLPSDRIHELEPGGVVVIHEQPTKPPIKKKVEKAGKICGLCGDWLCEVDSPKEAVELILRNHQRKKHGQIET